MTHMHWLARAEHMLAEVALDAVCQIRELAADNYKMDDDNEDVEDDDDKYDTDVYRKVFLMHLVIYAPNAKLILDLVKELMDDK